MIFNSYEYLVHYKSKVSHKSPPPTIMLILALEWLTYIKHIVQSLQNMHVFLVCILTSTPNPKVLKSRCPILENDHE